MEHCANLSTCWSRVRAGVHPLPALVVTEFLFPPSFPTPVLFISSTSVFNNRTGGEFIEEYWLFFAFNVICC